MIEDPLDDSRGGVREGRRDAVEVVRHIGGEEEISEIDDALAIRLARFDSLPS